MLGLFADWAISGIALVLGPSTAGWRLCTFVCVLGVAVLTLTVRLVVSVRCYYPVLLAVV